MSEFLKDLSVFSFYEISEERCGVGCRQKQNTTKSGSNTVLDLTGEKQHKR